MDSALPMSGGKDLRPDYWGFVPLREILVPTVVPLGRAAGLATLLHDGGDPVVNLQEGNETARTAAAGELLAA
jgi:hypothetical protein